jgi:hypothetical protein
MKKNSTRLLTACLISLSLTIIAAGQVFARTVSVDSEAPGAARPDVGFDRELVAKTQFTDVTRKAPYLIYNGDNTEMQVLWQLTSADTCTIEWGTDTLYALGNAQTYEYGGDLQHTYTIGELIPGYKYYYRVTANEEIHTGSFRSAPDTNATSIKFMAYGDTRTYPADHNQVAGAMVASYADDEHFQSFALSVGDLVGAGNSESDWDNQFFHPSYANIQELLANVPYQSCMGNHEQAGLLFKKYFPYPFVAGRYWSFDYGPAHFVVVDQYTSYGPGSAQLTWIENDLAATTKPWKFIYLHEPGWSAGSHSNNTSVQNYIQPLCEQYGVSIVFAGHNHYYARAVVNDVQHVTTGGGGAPLYAPNPSYPNVVAAAMAHHFCAVEIDGDVLDFKAITKAGTVIDSFTITPAVGVELDEAEPPIPDFVLYPAYPNPFNPSTTLSFSIPTASYVEVNVYNVLGQRIQNLVNGKLEAGYHRYSWNGKDDLGQDVSSGVYIYKLQVGDWVQGNKILLLR